ncbi:hypothetical protein G6F52_013924 [Rhizopus delemar]|nr:hypothetical protein G6F52_013924 [Rhizopus delemar]
MAPYPTDSPALSSCTAMISELSDMAGFKPKDAASASANGDAPYRQMPGRTQCVWVGEPTARSAKRSVAAELQTLIAPGSLCVTELKTANCSFTPWGPSAQAKWVILPIEPTGPCWCSSMARSWAAG